VPRRLDSLRAALYLAAAMSLRPRALPAGFVVPCLPTNAPQPPSGDLWLHEIKHDGFRVIGRKTGKRVKLYSRMGDDLTPRFPQIVEVLERERSRSCIIDGEAVACGEDASRCSSGPLVTSTRGEHERSWRTGRRCRSGSTHAGDASM
jgi:ATP-dependent DNA ligase